MDVCNEYTKTNEESNMMPHWKDAPEWANYLAKDYDGEWYWYEEEPVLEYGQWVPPVGRMIAAELQKVLRIMDSKYD
jgi:hypothetical protein